MGDNEALARLRETGLITRIDAPAAPGAVRLAGTAPGEMLDLVGPVALPIQSAGRERMARWYVARPVADQAAEPEEVCVLDFRDPDDRAARPLVRIHSACWTGDVLGSLRCDCGPQLHAAVEQISDAPSGGLLIYMTSHEGRGIGLWTKAAAYALQNEGLDTYAANRALGFRDDERDFGLAAALVRHFLGSRSFELLTNNPLKVRSLQRLGVTAVVRRSLIEGMSSHNRCYLRAKRDHGHWFPG